MKVVDDLARRLNLLTDPSYLDLGTEKSLGKLVRCHPVILRDKHLVRDEDRPWGFARWGVVTFSRDTQDNSRMYIPAVSQPCVSGRRRVRGASPVLSQAIHIPESILKCSARRPSRNMALVNHGPKNLALAADRF